MQWSIVALMVSLLWSIVGIVIALWPSAPTSSVLTLDSLLDQIRMVVMLGVSIGLVGFTNLTETLIWICLIIGFAMAVVFFVQRNSTQASFISSCFLQGLVIGAIGGGIAAFIQLFILTTRAGKLQAMNSWLAPINFNFDQLLNQLFLLPFTAGTRGLLLGATAAFVGYMVVNKLPPTGVQSSPAALTSTTPSSSPPNGSPPNDSPTIVTLPNDSPTIVS